jgi:glycosyltransferase involved in cell wall biosynthesis
MAAAILDSPARSTVPERTPRRILVLHNRYKQPGGEDGVVAAEARLLRSAGHEVELLEADNTEIRGLRTLAAAGSAIYSLSSRARVAAAIARFQPDVMHCHNLFPLLSTSVYDAARKAGVPIVQTLHNFRMQCVNGLLLESGQVCERCVGKSFPYPAVRLGCYQGSVAASAAAATAIASNTARRTYLDKVDIFIALSEFCRNKFLEFGLPASRVVIKPNFLDVDPSEGDPCDVDSGRRHILFAGRIAPEKGLSTLLQAWPLVRASGVTLRIVGDGPDAAGLRSFSAGDPTVEWLGRLPQQEVRKQMRSAVALAVPSLWYEGFPLVVIEAFAAGTPVVASEIGSLPGIVGAGRAGLLVPPGSASDLARALNQLVAHPDEARAMGERARSVYEQQYTAATNLAMLEAVYDRAGAPTAEPFHARPLTVPSRKTLQPPAAPAPPHLPALPAARANPADPGFP